MVTGANDSIDSSTQQLSGQYLASVHDDDGVRNADNEGVKNADDEGVRKVDDDCDGDSLQVYSMGSNPRGLAIIINNKNIRGKNYRKGAQQDAKILQGLFGYLGFTIRLYNDLTAGEMEHTLRQIAESDHRAFSCLLVAILTHGEQMEVVYGIDKAISLPHLINLFDGINCPSLISKPKIFFVQACRGDEMDTGVDAMDGPSVDETDSGDLH